MKKILSYFLTLILVGTTYTALKAYTTKSDAMQAISSAIPRAFPGNLFTEGISVDGTTSWYGMLKGIENYIKSDISGISQANVDLFISDLQKVDFYSNELINTVKYLRNTNNRFEKAHYPNINIEQIKVQLQKLAPYKEQLAILKQELTPKYSDYKKTIEKKEILSYLVYALELTYEKLFRDFERIKTEIQSTK